METREPPIECVVDCVAHNDSGRKDHGARGERVGRNARDEREQHDKDGAHELGPPEPHLEEHSHGARQGQIRP